MYNAVNQLVNDGTNTLNYARNGNMLSDGVNSYAWDRANRLLSVGNASYKYDGLNNRIQQTVNSVVTDYLNDVQPGLTKLLRQDDGTNVKHFIHAPRGIHAVDDGTSWNYYLQDGLGSVRNDGLSYSPVGVPSAAVGDFSFTGEYTNGELLYLRARYMSPNMGTFLSLDPFEGVMDRPMSLNGYSWVEGNVPNAVDPAGLQGEAVSGACLAFIAGDGPFPFGDAACLALLAGAGIYAVATSGAANDIYNAAGSVANTVGGAISSAANDAYHLIFGGGETANPPVDVPANIPQNTDWPRLLSDLCNQTGWCGTAQDIVETVLEAVLRAANGGVLPMPGDRGVLPFPETQTGRRVVPEVRADDDAIPIPFPQDRPFPEDYNSRFDVALGISQYLLLFAASFRDYPTIPWQLWPDWMMEEPVAFTAKNANTVANAVIASLLLWQASPSRGRIKFNLEGVRSVSNTGEVHKITLLELRKILNNPILLPLTNFYRFETGVPRRLFDTELVGELVQIAPLFGRL